jgi:hypothetical protein
MVPRRQTIVKWATPVVVGVLVVLVGISEGQQDPLCPHLGGCLFEAPGFTIRVVDEQTGQPVPDAHAMAVWIALGMWGRNYALMALEAVSQADGSLTFPAWGPMRGSEGLMPGRDPVISIFKPGYRALLLYNATPFGQPDSARVHAFHLGGRRVELTQFQGTPAEGVAELRKAAYPSVVGSPSVNQPASIRAVYVNHLRRVRTEAERLPRGLPDVKRLLDRLDDDIQAFSAGGER